MAKQKSKKKAARKKPQSPEVIIDRATDLSVSRIREQLAGASEEQIEQGRLNEIDEELKKIGKANYIQIVNILKKARVRDLMAYLKSPYAVAEVALWARLYLKSIVDGDTRAASFIYDRVYGRVPYPLSGTLAFQQFNVIEEHLVGNKEAPRNLNKENLSGEVERLPERISRFKDDHLEGMFKNALSDLFDDEKEV